MPPLNDIWGVWGIVLLLGKGAAESICKEVEPRPRRAKFFGVLNSIFAKIMLIDL